MSTMNMAGGAVYRSGIQGAAVGRSGSTSSKTISSRDAAKAPRKISIPSARPEQSKRD